MIIIAIVDHEHKYNHNKHSRGMMIFTFELTTCRLDGRSSFGFVLFCCVIIQLI